MCPEQAQQSVGSHMQPSGMTQCAEGTPKVHFSNKLISGVVKSGQNIMKIYARM